MRKLNLKEIQKCELDILLELQRVCKANGIQVSLIGGTLLGAIRHHGFIPWDDDIDVLVSRDDYEKLLHDSAIEQQFSKNIKITSFEKGNSPYPFIKLVDSRTVVKNEYLQNKFQLGIWIDVFPVDGLPDKRSEQEKIFKKEKFWRLVLGEAITTGRSRHGLFGSMLKIILMPFAKIIGIRRCNDVLRRNAIGFSVEESVEVAPIVWGLGGSEEKMNRLDFVKQSQVTFENHDFTTINSWENYLLKHYGKNYMDVPDINNRETHHIDAWIK